MSYFNQWYKSKHGKTYLYVLNIQDNYENYYGFKIRDKRMTIEFHDGFYHPKEFINLKPIIYSPINLDIKNIEHKMIKSIFSVNLSRGMFA